jgi:hypothetical protein
MLFCSGVWAARPIKTTDIKRPHAPVAGLIRGIHLNAPARCQTAFNQPSVAVNNRMQLDKAKGWMAGAQRLAILDLYLGHLKKRRIKKS